MANNSAVAPPCAPGPVFLAGPTAVGKSAVALALAEAIGGEIISVDSMQVYRGLDLGTAKPTPAEQTRVPHHLLDVSELRAAFDAAQFVQLAQTAMQEIQARGRTPIFCGGTGLYFTAFLEGLGEAPATNEKLRAELAAAPLAELLAELQARDPVTFETIDRKNPRRVLRAVEVIRLTGRKYSEQRAAWSAGSPDRGDLPAARDPSDGSAGLRPGSMQANTCQQAGSETGAPLPGEPTCLPDPSTALEPASRTRTRTRPSPAPESDGKAAPMFCFTRHPEDLHRRIHTRVDEMFARGLVEETRRLLTQGLAENQNAMQAIGYRQVVEHLRGERGLAETIALVKTRTRQFAKRQLTWFRRHGHWQTIELPPEETPQATLTRILTGLKSFSAALPPSGYAR